MSARRRTLATVAVMLLAAVAVPGIASAQTGAGGNDCTYPVSATDATGENVTVGSAPDSVVALQPSDAQTMWDIGARDQVVAMPQTQYTSYLEDRGDRTDVKNDDGSVDVEVVTNTSADLVLAANATKAATVRQLRRANLTVYHFDQARSIEDVYEQVDTIGRLTGNCEAADETVESMRSDVESVRSAVENRDRPRVLYYFFEFTAGTDTHIHDLIRTAGGSNVAAEAGISDYQPLNTEVVVEADPQWIVYPSDAQVPTSAPYNTTTAVRENQTLSVDTYYVSQPGPRIVRPLHTMAEAFHPEAFDNRSSANETAVNDSASDEPTVSETATADATTSADATPSAEATTGESGPGFGPLASLSAGLAAAVLSLGLRGRRR